MNKEPINIFDFDGTLTTETWPKFWVWVKKFGYSGEKRNDELEAALAKYRSTHEGDSLETFFGFFHDLLVNNNQTLTNEELMEGEKYIKYNPGLYDFIEKSIAKNYIVSGGIREFLKNLKIAKYFDDSYGIPVEYNQDGKICGIGEIMTDDKKVLAIKDILKRNNRSENDCNNVYYIGDGYSDATAMRFVHENGGKAIFVHQPTQDDAFFEYNNEIYLKLQSEGIADFCCVADYSDESPLSQILQREEKEKGSNLGM